MSPDPSVSAALEVASLLGDLLDEPIVIADVGCRWGFADTWEQLGGRCRAVGFEPDEDECERLRKRYQDRPGVEIVGHALGREVGTATLHVTREPARSSLYRPLDDVVDRHPRLEPQRLAHSEQIDLDTIDDWCVQSGTDHIDVIKLDTQGSELDVLRGAARTLDRIIAVQTEVEFNRMYEGQPLFEDIDRFLREHDFVLWHLDNLSHHRQHGARAALQQSTQFFDFDVVQFSRRSGQLFWADALFVRADVARPRPHTPWTDALRHACVTAALGPSRPRRARTRSPSTAPRRPRTGSPSTRRCRSSPNPTTKPSGSRLRWASTRGRGRRQAEVGTEGILDAELVVQLGESIDGAGWREPERFGSSFGRWTGPGREAWIDLPLRMPSGTRVALTVATIREARRLWNDRYRSERSADRRGARRARRGLRAHRCGAAEYESDRSFTRVSIRTPEPVPRHGTPDPRKVCLAVTELRLRPPSKSPEPGQD